MTEIKLQAVVGHLSNATWSYDVKRMAVNSAPRGQNHFTTLLMITFKIQKIQVTDFHLPSHNPLKKITCE